MKVFWPDEMITLHGVHGLAGAFKRLVTSQSLNISTTDAYCRKVVADGVGQRLVGVVVLNAVPPPRRVQHSPSVEQ